MATPKSFPIKVVRCEPGFAKVAAAFKANFDDGDEIGSSLVIYYQGRKVVELYGGYTDYDESTLNVVFSSGKTVESIVAAYLVSTGKLDYEALVSAYWPEFGRYDKENVKVKDVLGHRGGLSWFDARHRPRVEDWQDLELMAHLIAEQPHNFAGITTYSYHAATRGWVLNEIFRRVSGNKSFGVLVNELFTPYGVEFYCGTPDSVESSKRICDIVPWPYGREGLKPQPAAKELPASTVAISANVGRVTVGVTEMIPVVNTRVGRKGQAPSFNCVTNANGLATIAAIMAGGGSLNGERLISVEAMKKADVEQELMTDVNSNFEIRLTNAGYAHWPEQTQPWFPNGKGSNRRANWCWSGWMGLGGSVCQWDQNHNVSMGFVMNGAHPSAAGDRRTQRIRAALCDAVDALTVSPSQKL
ncbi:hypothetical protein SmJEL517_g00332 [Synchytrium microbalum]|uniref:Beta-lactamase-related domain-containing protein n=1 Tax=Synchytrium microbalum TaxID=1806994 RepID=A0A507CAL5_9FUNG|nr:uncharacterized protein SmJEL517_g00332 [Synchytrium microbalum]TPX38097.1 hypothetical protein SmJEL517_g00332 [Synchytrium microbalum]